jgi:hypothetical protein
VSHAPGQFLKVIVGVPQFLAKRIGLPLDLAVLNLARGRDVGIPSLNEARRDFYTQTGDTWVKPYTSWADLVQHLKHPESLINFIAAYGTHGSITSATTLAAKRAAAALLLLFLTYPLGLGVYLGFTDAKIGRPGEWIGIENYAFLVTDSVFRLSVWNTFLYTSTASTAKFVLGVMTLSPGGTKLAIGLGSGAGGVIPIGSRSARPWTSGG